MLIGYSDGSVHIRRIDSNENGIQLVLIIILIFIIENNECIERKSRMV